MRGPPSQGLANGPTIKLLFVCRSLVGARTNGEQLLTALRTPSYPWSRLRF